MPSTMWLPRQTSREKRRGRAPGAAVFVLDTGILPSDCRRGRCWSSRQRSATLVPDFATSATRSIAYARAHSVRLPRAPLEPRPWPDPLKAPTTSRRISRSSATRSRTAESSLIAKHDEFYNVAVKPFSGGMLVMTFFGTTGMAKSQRVGFLEFLNDMNKDAIAARYYEDADGDVMVEGWYPGDYDRTRFGVFMNKFNEVSDQLGDSDIADDYLGSGEPEEGPVASPPSATTAEEPAKRPSATAPGSERPEHVRSASERAGERTSD